MAVVIRTRPPLYGSYQLPAMVSDFWRPADSWYHVVMASERFMSFRWSSYTDVVRRLLVHSPHGIALLSIMRYLKNIKSIFTITCKME